RMIQLNVMTILVPGNSRSRVSSRRFDVRLIPEHIGVGADDRRRQPGEEWMDDERCEARVLAMQAGQPGAQARPDRRAVSRGVAVGGELLPRLPEAFNGETSGFEIFRIEWRVDDTKAFVGELIQLVGRHHASRQVPSSARRSRTIACSSSSEN